MRKRRHFARDERGSITIEFVVMLPLFLAALAFTFEFGRVFVAHQGTVNNVRSAMRYLSRSDLSGNDVTAATNIVRTGVPAGGAAPDYLASATVDINTNYKSEPTAFSRPVQTIRIFTKVEIPLLIFGFVDSDGPAKIPFVVVEDMRHVGA